MQVSTECVTVFLILTKNPSVENHCIWSSGFTSTETGWFTGDMSWGDQLSDIPNINQTLWSTEEMLDGQCQRGDVLAHARTAHGGLQKTTGRGFLLSHPSCPFHNPTCQGTKLNEHCQTRMILYKNGQWGEPF